MRVLLLSAYDAQSHKSWREQLLPAFAEYDWTVLTLPPRYFSWRIRGNSLSWAFEQQEVLEQGYDLVLATSMVDLSALRGFIPSLAQIPTLVYFHENQFAYPANDRQYSTIEPQILNLYTALAADRLVFNSAYNRDSFLAGVRQLLLKLPDKVPGKLVEKLIQISEVVPVPIGAEFFNAGTDFRLAENQQQPLRIVWNHRHEHDKGPDRLLAVVRELEARAVDYSLVILGQQFRHELAEFSILQAEFPHRLAHFGFVDTREEYRQWLATGDIVLSTSTQEFQGLSVLEAVCVGCIPVLPDRLAYPELLGREYLYASIPDDIAAEAVCAVDAIIGAAQLSVPDVSRFSMPRLKRQYQRAFLRVSDLDKDPY